jgi:hypothetical protein
MTAQGNGQGAVYKVILSGQVKARLEELHLKAAQLGKGKAFVATLRRIVERLRRDPLVFREPQYRLPALNLVVCQAAISPLVVDYAVHTETALVFIRAFKLLS